MPPLPLLTCPEPWTENSCLFHRRKRRVGIFLQEKWANSDTGTNTYIFNENHNTQATHSHDTRFRNQVQPVRTNREYTKNTIRYYIPSLPLELNNDLRNRITTHSLQSYKASLKKFFIDKYQNQCLKPNCYVCSQ